MLGEDCREVRVVGGSRRAHRREDAAAAGVQLLVRRPGGAQRELLDAVAGEARVRVAVDEARDRREPATVDLLDVVIEARQVAHRSRRRDATVLAQHVRVSDDVDLAQRVAAKRRGAPRRRRDLREVADEESRRRLRGAHDPTAATEGMSMLCSRAAASASS